MGKMGFVSLNLPRLHYLVKGGHQLFAPANLSNFAQRFCAIALAER